MTPLVEHPLRYRGYVYDTDTGLYYLQSRYYDPTIGRFINADVYASTGQGVLGHNMFAYCGNNPVVRSDVSGEFWVYEVSVVTTTQQEEVEGNITYVTTITYTRQRPPIYSLFGAAEKQTQTVSFLFTVQNDGAVTFDSKQDHASNIEVNALRSALVREMLSVSRKQVDGALSGRSVDGLSYELIAHYLAYKNKVPYLWDNGEVANMGGTWIDGPGYDSNACVFEAYAAYNNLRRRMPL